MFSHLAMAEKDCEVGFFGGGSKTQMTSLHFFCFVCLFITIVCHSDHDIRKVSCCQLDSVGERDLLCKTVGVPYFILPNLSRFQHYDS